MSTSKKLYRVDEDKMFLGVSSGLAEYTGIDVNLIRILFVLLALSGGLSVVVYLVLGIILSLKEEEMKEVEIIEEDEYSYNEEDYEL